MVKLNGFVVGTKTIAKMLHNAKLNKRKSNKVSVDQALLLKKQQVLLALSSIS